MAHIDPVDHLGTDELIEIVRPPAEAWFNNLELLALQELLRRLPSGQTTLDHLTRGGPSDDHSDR